MPIYEYKCLNCDFEFEVLKKITDPIEEKCPKCKGKTEKKISICDFVLKGKGFHKNDYK